MREKYENIIVQPVQFIHTMSRQKTVIRQIPTMYGFHMRRMTSNGPSGSTYEDEVLVVPGIGKNSAGYEAPYNESQSGKTHIYFIYLIYLKTLCIS